MFAGKKSAQIREILISESAWEEMTCLFAPSLVARFPAQDELIVITDIFAGSVNNEFVRFLSRPHFHLLSGLNLPLIIDLLISAAEDNTEKLITEALTNAKESIQYCNQTIASAMTMDKDF